MAYFGPLKLNNQKDPKAKLRKREKPALKQRPGMSEDHLSQIRQLPCARCGSFPPSDPHHLKSLVERGMAMRSSDRWTVPLCRGCHDDVERVGTKREISWFGDFGVDPHDLAAGLWNVSGDLDRMQRVLQAHREK